MSHKFCSLLRLEA